MGQLNSELAEGEQMEGLNQCEGIDLQPPLTLALSTIDMMGVGLVPDR